MGTKEVEGWAIDGKWGNRFQKGVGSICTGGRTREDKPAVCRIQNTVMISRTCFMNRPVRAAETMAPARMQIPTATLLIPVSLWSEL